MVPLGGAAGDKGGGRPGERSPARVTRPTPRPPDNWTARDGARETNPDVRTSGKSESPESKARPVSQRLLGLTPSPSQTPTRTGTLPTGPRMPATRPALFRPTCVPPGVPNSGEKSPRAPVLTARGQGSAHRRARPVHSLRAHFALRRDRGHIQGCGQCWTAARAPRPASTPTPASQAQRARGALCRRLRLPDPQRCPDRYRPHLHRRQHPRGTPPGPALSCPGLPETGLLCLKCP